MYFNTTAPTDELILGHQVLSPPRNGDGPIAELVLTFGYRQDLRLALTWMELRQLHQFTALVLEQHPVKVASMVSEPLFNVEEP